LPGLWRANGAIGPILTLAKAAQGIGALVAAADPDGPIRRVPLLVLAGATVRPGLAVEAIRLAQGAAVLVIDARGMLMVGPLALPLGRDAMLRLAGLSAVPVIPAARLIDDPAARTTLTGRIVLIGSSAPEVGGLRVTPTSPATPSVQIQAAAIEAILGGQVFTRPVWVEFAEPAGAALLGVFCLLIAARLRPVAATLLALFLCLAGPPWRPRPFQALAFSWILPVLRSSPSSPLHRLQLLVSHAMNGAHACCASASNST
jgi:adenylate cyclase